MVALSANNGGTLNVIIVISQITLQPIKGGAIYSSSDPPDVAVNIIFGSTFTGNTATMNGGAIYNEW